MCRNMLRLLATKVSAFRPNILAISTGGMTLLNNTKFANRLIFMQKGCCGIRSRIDDLFFATFSQLQCGLGEKKVHCHQTCFKLPHGIRRFIVHEAFLANPLKTGRKPTYFNVLSLRRQIPLRFVLMFHCLLNQYATTSTSQDDRAVFYTEYVVTQAYLSCNVVSQTLLEYCKYTICQ